VYSEIQNTLIISVHNIKKQWQCSVLWTFKYCSRQLFT